MKHVLAVLFAFFATSAFALGFGNDNPGGTGIATANQGQTQGQLQGQAQGLINVNDISVSNRISNDVRSNALSFAGGGTSGSSSGSNAVSSSGGNTLTVNEAPIPADTSVRFSGDYTVRNTPGIALGNVYPTAPCMGSSTVGGSGPGFSIGIGTSWKDDECGKRETARSFSGMGLKDDALAILCTSEYAAAAPSCVKLKPE